MLTEKISCPNLDICCLHQESWVQVLCTFCYPPIPDARQSCCTAGSRSNEPHFMRGFQVSAFAGTDCRPGAGWGQLRIGDSIGGWIQHHPLSSAPWSQIQDWNPSPPLCATDLLLSSPIPGHLHILSFLTTAGDTIAPKKQRRSICWNGLGLWLSRAARTCFLKALARPTSHRNHSRIWLLVSLTSGFVCSLLQNILLVNVLVP